MLRRLLREQAGGAGGRSVIVGAVIAASIFIGGYAVSGGGGGGQSCAAYPSFPDASCTGVPSGTSLTAYTGPTTITVANTTIDSKTITDCLDIQATGVTISNSLVQPVGCTGTAISDDSCTSCKTQGNDPLTITDTTIQCQFNSNRATHPRTGIEGDNITVTRADIYECENGGAFDKYVTFQDNYVHDLAQCLTYDCTEPDVHTDGVETWQGVDITYRHNTIYAYSSTCTGGGAFDVSDGRCNGTSAWNVNGVGANGTSTNVLITENLTAGGAYDVYCPPNTTSNFQITNNHFSTVVSSNVGYFGPSNACASNETLSSNVYHESGLPITLD